MASSVSTIDLSFFDALSLSEEEQQIVVNGISTMRHSRCS